MAISLVMSCLTPFRKGSTDDQADLRDLPIAAFGKTSAILIACVTLYTAQEKEFQQPKTTASFGESSHGRMFPHDRIPRISN